MDVRLTWTDCDEAGDYVVPNVLSSRDLVSRPENMEETVLHAAHIELYCLPVSSHYRRCPIPVNRPDSISLVCNPNKPNKLSRPYQLHESTFIWIKQYLFLVFCHITFHKALLRDGQNKHFHVRNS